jgi:hypothetical protein
LEVPYVQAEPYFRNNNKWGYSYTLYIYNMNLYDTEQQTLVYHQLYTRPALGNCRFIMGLRFHMF